MTLARCKSSSYRLDGFLLSAQIRGRYVVTELGALPLDPFARQSYASMLLTSLMSILETGLIQENE